MNDAAPPPDAPPPAAPSLRANAVLALALGAALLLVLALFGLLPARESAAVAPARFDPEQAVERPRLRPPTAAAAAAPAHRLSLWSFPLCEPPAAGARLHRVGLRPDRDALLVWCQREYLLVDVELGAERPRVVRLGRFPARAELSGGAAALDLDRDGVLDLALGVAPEARVVHRSFSGVYWLRGRPQGGYELPRSLVEMPPAGIAAVELDAEPGSELLVLTRGDAAAQRPGELWIFRGGTSPSRVAVVPAALAPSELALGEAREAETDVWVVSTQPGALIRLRFARESAAWASGVAREELPLRGVQGLVAAPRAERALYVRDPRQVYRVETEAAARLAPWREQAELGPAAWFHAAGDGEPALLGASAGGLVWVDGRQGAARVRALPPGVRLLDVSSLSAGSGPPQGVLLVAMGEQDAKLALVVLPSALRDETTDLELRTGAVEAAPGEARVALE